MIKTTHLFQEVVSNVINDDANGICKSVQISPNLGESINIIGFTIRQHLIKKVVAKTMTMTRGKRE